jgi:hypothetical protein
MLAVFSLPAGGQVHAATMDTHYVCDEHQKLVVHRHVRGATVEFIDRTYELVPRPSSIGEKYVSPTAALIIDGTSAVFVAEDRLQLGACVEASPATEPPASTLGRTTDRD